MLEEVAKPGAEKPGGDAGESDLSEQASCPVIISDVGFLSSRLDSPLAR
jgi:hypothetical protein